MEILLDGIGAVIETMLVCCVEWVGYGLGQGLKTSKMIILFTFSDSNTFDEVHWPRFQALSIIQSNIARQLASNLKLFSQLFQNIYRVNYLIFVKPKLNHKH
jgi:hypothetical protein